MNFINIIGWAAVFYLSIGLSKMVFKVIRDYSYGMDTMKIEYVHVCSVVVLNWLPHFVYQNFLKEDYFAVKAPVQRLTNRNINSIIVDMDLEHCLMEEGDEILFDKEEVRVEEVVKGTDNVHIKLVPILEG